MHKTVRIVLALAALVILGALLIATNVPLNASALPVPQDVVTADVATLTPDADAYVDSVQSGQNYGSAHQLQVQDYLGRDATRRSLLRFNLSSQVPSNATITSAYLELYLEGGNGANPITLRFAPATFDWQETLVTWNTQPAVGSPAISHNVDLNPGYKRFDVTSIVQTWQTGTNYGIEVRESSAGQAFNRTSSSREDAARTPRLVVSFTLPAGTSTPTATAKPPPTRTPTRTATRTPTRTPTVTPFKIADLIATDLEVTQAVQDLNNSVRLVAGKRTFVRFYVRSGGGSTWGTAQLTVQHGAAVAVLGPINTLSGALLVSPTPNRGNLYQSFLFELPEGFRTGTVNLAAQVKTQSGVTDISPGNNQISRQVTYETSPTINVVVFRIGYKFGGQKYYPPVDDVDMMIDWLRRAFPTPKITYSVRTLYWGSMTRKWVIDPDTNKGSWKSTSPTCSQVNNHLLFLQIQDRLAGKISASTRYYGMVLVDDSIAFMRGCAPVPGTVASGPTGPDT